MDGGDMDGGDMDGGVLPTEPPDTVTMIANVGFQSPTDAVASPDGATFYFAAFTPMGEPAVFRVSSMAGGAVTRIDTAGPLQYPSGLVLSCDGNTLFIADVGSGGDDGMGDAGAVFSMPITGGVPNEISITGLDAPNALAFDADCSTLYVSGRNDQNEGAVYSVGVAGGAASVVHEGAPFVDTTGLYVAADDTVYVLDHLADENRGVLYSIASGGDPVVVVRNLTLGTPGGLSLTPGGGNAVIGSRNAAGEGVLLAIDLATMGMTEIDADSMVDPAGLRTARSAGIYALADSEGNAIYRAE